MIRLVAALYVWALALASIQANARFLNRWRACLRGRYPPSQPIKNESTVTAESRQAISQRDREFAAALWFERRH